MKDFLNFSYKEAKPSSSFIEAVCQLSKVELTMQTKQ